MINWTAIFNRLMSLMDQQGPSYFGGPRFIKAIQEIDPYLDDYGLYMEQRNLTGRSTTRRDYFKDILMDMKDGDRVRAVLGILNQLQTVDGNAERVSEIRAMLGAQREESREGKNKAGKGLTLATGRARAIATAEHGVLRPPTADEG